MVRLNSTASTLFYKQPNLNKNDVFWDIGCGVGKPMLIASLSFPQFKAIKGVEYLEGVYEMGK